MKTVLVSGGFDPLHVGHLLLLQEASEFGELTVLVNNDNWLMAKKKYCFMPEEDRVEIISALACVKDVKLTNHLPDTTDMSVCDELRQIRPDVFANGGDRKEGDIPEYDLCRELGIEMIFNIGGGKVRSSSELVAESKKRK